jgi:hypothetical protein
VDATHNTGRRVNLPYPHCSVRVSDCEDLDVINTLDGFGLQTRMSVPFDGPIDVNTATTDTVFLINLGSTRHRGDDAPGTMVGWRACGLQSGGRDRHCVEPAHASEPSCLQSTRIH